MPALGVVGGGEVGRIRGGVVGGVVGAGRVVETGGDGGEAGGKEGGAGQKVVCLKQRKGVVKVYRWRVKLYPFQ